VEVDISERSWYHRQADGRNCFARAEADGCFAGLLLVKANRWYLALKCSELGLAAGGNSGGTSIGHDTVEPNLGVLGECVGLPSGGNAARKFLGR
jgi:hypothetical protein